MNRELKFRAWDKYNKQMWKSIDSISLFFTNMEELQMADNGIIYMQYTGLKDKNGIEIYEGDICKCHDHPTGIEDAKGEVIFNQGRYWIGTGSICSLDDYGTDWTEVLGNKYSNPELLTAVDG